MPIPGTISGYFVPTSSQFLFQTFVVQNRVGTQPFEDPHLLPSRQLQQTYCLLLRVQRLPIEITYSTFVLQDLRDNVEKGTGEGGRSRGRGRVPGRTGRRSRCCGFAEVLGFFRAELYGTNIGFRELRMTAWSFGTSLTKWDAVTRSGW